MLHEIYFGQGDQPLHHVPPLRVASATYSIEDTTLGEDNADRVLDSGAATVDAFDEALTAASGSGTTDPRAIAAAGGSAVVGAPYVLEADDGQSELVTAAGASANAVQAASPISGQYAATTSRLRGVRLSATFPSADAAREELLEEDRMLLVTWTYTIAERVVVMRDQIRVMRGTARLANVGTVEQYLRDDWPELCRQLPGRGNAVRKLVASCERELVAKMLARRMKPEDFFSGPQGNQIVTLNCLWRFGKRGFVPEGTDIETWREEAKTDFIVMWRALTVGSPGERTADVDPATNEAPPGASRRRGGMIRMK